MNERQQAVFLWSWSRRRALGRARAALIGAGVGALAGLAFAIVMLTAMTASGGASLNEDAMPPWMFALGKALGPAVFLFIVSVPPFAAMGAFLADRVWALQERQYHTLLAAGARVPDERPNRA
jgi:hypothetical protein